MGEIHVEAERAIDAPAGTVYTVLADYREHHPKILPEAFEDLTVHEGGVGAGTVFSYTLNAGGRRRAARARCDEPEPGRVLRETDTETSLVTTFTVSPQGDARSRVVIDTRWESAGGIGGFFERTFAPRVLRRLYAEELERLDGYARGLAARTEPSAAG
jgi:hypothetical protein